MVLQRGQKDRAWGWPDPGEDVTFTIDGQTKTAKAGEDGKWTVTLDHVGGGLREFDVPEPRGFAIAASGRKFVWAKAKLVARDKVEVWSDEVSDPVAVRYAWADNPVCNLYSQEGLPVTPFRTDDWPGVMAESK